MLVSRTLGRTGCKPPGIIWAALASHQRLISVCARQKKRRSLDGEQPEPIDSTTELLLNQVDSTDGGALDIDELLNDAEAMHALRSMLKHEMAAAHNAAAAAAAAAAPAQLSKQGSSRRARSRAFDSDEYDSSALESVIDTADQSSDVYAEDAAESLLFESREIAEHILEEHKSDRLLEDTQQQQTRQGSRSKASSSSSGDVQTFKLQLPSFAVPGRGQQQQQQQGRGSSSSRPQTPESKSSQGSSSSGKQQGGSRGTPGSRSSGNSGSSRGSSGSGGQPPKQLSPDTAIGRVAEAQGGVPVVVLKKGKARLFELGSPMVYGGAVDYVLARPPPAAGDVVVVADHQMAPLAWGVYNPHSMFRVRVLQTESEALAADDSLVLHLKQLLDTRLQQAVELRSTLGLPSSQTTAYRLVNSEGDRLSGLTADVMGDVLVVQSCAAWTERYRDSITQLLLKHSGCSRVVWRPAAKILKEEGLDYSSSSSSSYDEDTVAAAAAAGGSTDEADGSKQQQQQQKASSSGSSSSGGSGSSSVQGTVEVKEAGLTFLATPEAGQKTGFYADQRQNRAFIASLSAGKTVLDLCCYSGGFALLAAAAGAAAVTGVDSSASAVQLAQDNAQLNGLSDRCAFVRDDVSTFLRAALEAGEVWDVVVLDPPKLAPNRASLARATNKYRRLNELALGVVKPGGVLMTCSCSGAMTQAGGLSKIVQEAAVAAERQLTLLSKAGAAADHPLHPAYPEGEYLTALTYRVI